MTNQLINNHGDGGDDTTSLHLADDISDVTPPGKGGKKGKDQKIIEKTLKFRFIHNRHAAVIHPSKIHLHWIQAVQESFGNDVVIMTNTNKVMPRVDTLTWTTEQHKKQYNIHDQDTKQQGDNEYTSSSSRDKSFFIVHRVRTSVTIQEMKSVPKVYELLRKHNCFLTEHRWTEDIWNTTQLGFLQGLDPQYYDLAHATSKVATELKRHFPSKHKIPKFHLAYCTPKITYNGKQIRTKAYAIETEKSTSMDMLKILKFVYQKTTEFTSFQLRNKHPEAYARILLQQTKTISNNHVIILNNVSTDAMYYLSDRITSVDGVQDLIAAPNTEYLGKYKVLVNKAQFHQVRKILLASLNPWYDMHVPEDAKQPSDMYSGKPEVAPLHTDGLSSGDGTYMSSSVNTAMSYESAGYDWTFTETDSTKDPPSQGTMLSTQPSWAERVKGPALSSNTSAENNPRTSTPSAITIDEELVSDLASSRAEVDDLRRKVQILEEDKEKHQKDMAVQAAQQKREMELQAAEQKLDFERQAENQRRDLEAKMEEQRKQMEQQAAAKQEELEQRMAQQIASALQRHMETNAPPRASQTPDFTRMFENHDRQLQILTNMMEKMLPVAPPSSTAQNLSGKRPAIIDLTVDTEDMYGMHHEAESAIEQRDIRKRPDLKATPSKLLTKRASGVDHKRHLSPTSSTSSSCDISQTPHITTSPNPLEHYHHECTIRSPMSYTNSQHPLYPGQEDDHDSLIDDDALMTGPPIDPFVLQPGILHDEILSPAHLSDIENQHQLQSNRLMITPNKLMENTHEELSAPFHSSNRGSETRPTQATPVEFVNPIQQSDV